MICPEERREQKLYRVQDEEYSGDDDDQDFYEDRDLFEENIQFHFNPEEGPGSDYGDDYQEVMNMEKSQTRLVIA